MEGKRCIERIMEGFRMRQCNRKAVRDGYCKQHHPDSVRKRAEERAVRYEEKRKESPYYKLGVALKELKLLRAELAQAQERAAALDMLEDMLVKNGYAWISSGEHAWTAEVKTAGFEINSTSFAVAITASYKQFKGE